MNNVSDFLTKLTNLQCTLSFSDFSKTFESSTAKHLWNKFTVTFSYNLLNFFRYLDYENKQKFMKLI
jgi:hypothetical protein